MTGLEQEERRLIASGASSRIFDLGDGRVVKLFDPSVSDEMIRREAEAAAFAHDRGLPVARPLERRAGDGERATVYPLLDGRSLQSVLRARWPEAKALLSRMAALHDRVHQCSAPADLRSVKQVLETDIAYGSAGAALKQRATAYLRELPDGDRLLHGDYHIGNVMLVDDDMHVIDWAKAARGAVAADVVRTEMLLRFGMGPSDMLTNIWRDWAARFYVRRYLVLGAGDVDEEALAAWRPVVALAWLRARMPVRTRAFSRYLDRALRDRGLPSHS